MMTQLTDKHWAIKVPEQVKDFMTFMESIKNGDTDTPVGKFQFLFTTKTATEEDARKVVETIHIEEAPSPYNDFAGGWDTGYVDYENRGEFAGYQGDAGVFRKALKSLASLLRSKELDENKNYAIIEKLK